MPNKSVAQFESEYKWGMGEDAHMNNIRRFLFEMHGKAPSSSTFENDKAIIRDYCAWVAMKLCDGETVSMPFIGTITATFRKCRIGGKFNAYQPSQFVLKIKPLQYIKQKLRELANSAKRLTAFHAALKAYHGKTQPVRPPLPADYVPDYRPPITDTAGVCTDIRTDTGPVQNGVDGGYADSSVTPNVSNDASWIENGK